MTEANAEIRAAMKAKVAAILKETYETAEKAIDQMFPMVAHMGPYDLSKALIGFVENQNVINETLKSPDLKAWGIKPDANGGVFKLKPVPSQGES